MSTLFAQNTLLFGGEAFAMSAIVLALAWEASHLFRDRASLRHLIWAGAFVALLLLPVLAWVVPAQIHVMLPAPPVAPVASVISVPQDVTIAPVVAAAPQPRVFHFDVETIAFGLLSLYLAGVCAIALRGLAALFGLDALKRGSRAHIFDDLPRGRYQVRLSKSPNGYGPITWGLFRPIILLPFNAHFWPRERLQAVLLHETAHIARHDSLSQLLSLVVCALYWPNPLVWMAAHALRNEAELAADDQVIASGMRPSSYAGELLQLASEFRSRQPALAGMPLFMAAPSALEARVKSVLAPTQLRSGVTAMDVFKIGGVAVVAAAVLTFARPSLAQDAPPQVESTPLPPPPEMPAPMMTAAPLTAPTPPAAPTPLTAPTRLAAPSPLPAQAAIPPIPADPATPPDAVTDAVTASDAYPAVRVRQDVRTVHGHKVRRVWITMKDRDAADAMARVRPEIERAMADVRATQPDIARAQAEIRVHEAEIRAIQEQMPQIQAQVQAEIARIQPDIERAVAEARLKHLDLKIHEKMDRDMRRMELRIEMKDKNAAHESEDAPDAN